MPLLRSAFEEFLLQIIMHVNVVTAAPLINEALAWTYLHGDDAPNDPEMLYTAFGRGAAHRQTWLGYYI